MYFLVVAGELTNCGWVYADVKDLTIPPNVEPCIVVAVAGGVVLEFISWAAGRVFSLVLLIIRSCHFEGGGTMDESFNWCVLGRMK